MSNIFLSSSLLYLAAAQVGCIDEETGDVDGDCDERVYGTKPAALTSNIAVVSGLASVFFMPVIGAIVDFTCHRHALGWMSGLFLVLVQAVQIGTVPSTWFPMVILQAVAGCVLNVQNLATYAYLPELKRGVDESTMNRYTGWFQAIQFGSQMGFLMVIVMMGIILKLDTVQTAQVSQGMLVLILLWSSYRSWGQFLGPKPASHNLPEGHSSLWLEGFRQVWRTLSKLKQRHESLMWFLLAMICAEAGSTAFLVVAITFLSGELGYDGAQVGMAFILSLATSLAGTWTGSKILARTDPKRTMQLNMCLFAIVTAVGSMVMTKERAFLGYVWGMLWGFLIGFYYPAETLFFAAVTPKGQDAELTGFYVYCTQILVWFPPLIFSILIESGVGQRWGLLAMTLFQGLAAGLLALCAPWEDILAVTRTLSLQNADAIITADPTSN
jgi:MFS-type transporter involved in bile tolerance (Atg22 family)